MRSWDHETLLQKKYIRAEKKTASMTGSLWTVVIHFVSGDTNGPCMDLGLLPFALPLGILQPMGIKGIKGVTCGYILWI